MMKRLPRLCLLVFATAGAWSCDANRLPGPPSTADARAVDPTSSGRDGSSGSADVPAGARDLSSGAEGGDGRTDGNIGSHDLATTTDTTPVGLDAGSIPPDVPGSGDGVSTDVAPTADAYCGLQTVPTTHAPTDVLLVLDRSNSMIESIAEDCCCTKTCVSSVGTKMCATTASCTERWPALTSAVKAAMDGTPQINWGLKFFPSPTQGTNGCGVTSGVDVAINSTAATTVENDIENATPGGSTPTARAIANATAYLNTVTDQNKKVILLATDGEPNCKAGASNTNTSDADGTEAAIAAALAEGFKVYVVGIGPASIATLKQFAVAGGTGDYYPATSATDLTDALAAISKAVSSCTFVMDQSPPDPNNVAVYLDGRLLTQDAADGWSFGASPQNITLNGASCASITSGAAAKVQLLFMCQGGSPPPILN